MSNLNIQMILRLVDRMSAPARAAARPLQAIGQEAQDLQRQMAALGQQRAAAEQVEELGRKAGLADNQLENLRREAGRLADEETELARRLARTTDELARRGALPVDGRTRALAAGAAIGGAGASMRDRGSAMVAGAQSGAIGVLAAGYGASRFMGAAIQFDTAMRRVGAVSRASEEDLARLTATARQLGAETPWAASQAAEGMTFLAMAGFTVNDTIAAMPGMLDLASAGGIELANAADIASDTLSAFGMEAGQIGRLGDTLTNAFTSSNTTLTGLGISMRQVAPVAREAGVSLEQTTAMIGLLGNVGIKGEAAGTALRAVITRLAAPTGAAAEAMEQLNVAVADEDGNLRDLPTILREMEWAMHDMGTATRADIMASVFGLEAQAAASELLGQAASGNLDRYADSLAEAGSAARVASEMTAGIQGDLDRFRSVTEALAISIGSALLPELSDLIEQIIPLVDAARAWAEANPELVATIGKLAAAAVAVKAAIVVLGFTFGWIFGPLGRLLQGVGWLIRVLGGRGLGAAIMWLIRSPFRLLFTAFRIIAAFAVANPLVAAVAAIAGIGVLIYKNWDQIVFYFQDKIEVVRAAFDEGLLNGVLAALAELNPFRVMSDALNGLIEQITGINLTELLGSVDWGAIFGDPIAYLRSLFEGANAGSSGRAESRSSAGAYSSADLARVAGGSDGRARDAGGVVSAGGLYDINERGQELFAPGSAGRIINTTTLRSAMAGAPRAAEAAGPVTINVHAQPGQDAREIAAEVERRLQRRQRSSRALHDGGAYAD